MDIIDNLLKNTEGGYVNDPDDRGGETYMGISRKWWPDWLGWIIIDRYKEVGDGFEKLLAGNTKLYLMVYGFYENNFLAPFHMIQNEDIEAELFDTAVNMSVKDAKIILQRSLNLLNRNEKLFSDLIVDGIIGEKTIDAIEKVNTKRLLTVLNGEQYLHYRKDVIENPIQEKFFAGWMKRVEFETA